MQLFKNIQDELIRQIIQAEDSLKIAVTWFTNHDIFNAIIQKLINPHFKVTLIVLNDNINNKNTGLDFQFFIKKNGNFYYSSVENMVHHKFCIIDDKIVITGSYNWTYFAENRNWENIIILNNDEAVKAYAEEFNRLIEKHEKVQNVAINKEVYSEIKSNEYIITDSIIQAKQQEERGNNLEAAKIYTEILRLDVNKLEIRRARTNVIEKINSKQFKKCPFEIGIFFKNGYKMIIPAFTSIPTVRIKVGDTPINNATSLQITIQKYDYIRQTLLQFSIDNLKEAPANTPKIEITIGINEDGIMIIYCKELNGYGREKAETVDLKKFQ